VDRAAAGRVTAAPGGVKHLVDPRESGGKERPGAAVRTDCLCRFAASSSLASPLHGGGGWAAGKLSAPLPPPMPVGMVRAGGSVRVRRPLARHDTGRGGGAAVSGAGLWVSGHGGPGPGPSRSGKGPPEG